MAKQVLRNVGVIVDQVDLSDRTTSVTVDDGANEVDATAFGSVYTSAVKGMRTAQITATFQQDFDTGSVHDTLNALNDQSTTFEVLIVPDGDASGITATNPGFRIAEAHLLGYSPLSGGVGDLSTTDVTFTNAGDLGVEVLTSPPGP
jgi:hypothetical protein